MIEYWVSTTKITCGVKVGEDGFIVETAPIFKKFIGRPFRNLIRWLEKNFEGLTVIKL